MTRLRLVRRSAAYYWRTNLAVVIGVAAAVSVLGGALLVGDSVRGSLREIALSRLGRADVAVTSAGFFREAVAAREAAPLITATAFVTHEPSGKRAGGVTVYGVDERFWAFHGVQAPSGPAISQALATELGLQSGDTLLVRLQRPSEIPIESLFSRKEDLGRTIRLQVAEALPRERLGEFSLKQQQAELRAVFAPLRRVQRDLGVAEKVNTLLFRLKAEATDTGGDARSVRLEAAVPWELDDLGINVRVADSGDMVIVDSPSGILGEALETAIRATAAKTGDTPIPVFTYLANTMKVGERAVPYSLIAATDLALVNPQAPDHGIVLNAWAARELQAKPGDEVEFEYYLWDANKGLTTHAAKLPVTAIVPIAGFAADRQLAPEYPGITGAESLAEWDPPFPIDLSRVRDADEKYWDDYRATPKAFLSFARGRELWATRYGHVTSLRFAVPAGATAEQVAERLRAGLRTAIQPEAAGIATIPVRQQALAASQGATDFGQYFTYFSFFLVVSALLLAILFFRLGIEQRLRQIGVMRAAGFPVATIRSLLLTEAVGLAAIGGLLGAAGAVAYGKLIVYGLKTWWIGAVGTSQLELHVTATSLIGGVLGGVLAAALCVIFSLRSVARLSPRSLLTAQAIGQEPRGSERIGRRNLVVGAVFSVVSVAAVVAGFVSGGESAGLFFAAGGAALLASLFLFSSWLRSRPASAIAGRGTGPMLRLGFRSAAFRPGRSVLSAALIASAAFIIVSVDSFRKGGGEIGGDKTSGTGGYALIATSELPLLYDPNTADGREALIVQPPAFERVKFTRFRVRPGDDASCLNLYRPTNPTIVAPEAGFIEEARFTFASSLADSDAERANPWLLLKRSAENGPVPVIADATSLQYVLHAKVGDTFTIDVGGDQPLQLQFVGALADSVLQGELVMAEEHFVRLFPAQQGYRFFLVDAPGVHTREAAAEIAGALEQELETFGFDAVTAAERLEAFHRVENTYLSTFQSLGGLGLLLGTIGLAAVMFRNVLERRRELGLLRAVGYDGQRVTQMILAEAVLLLGAGLGAGALSAALAVAPAWFGRSGTRPGTALLLLLAAVAVAGIVSSAIAARAALRENLLESLRAE